MQKAARYIITIKCMAHTKSQLSNLILNIIEGVSDGILIQNEDGEILFFNDKLLELTGWNSDDVLFNQPEIMSKLKLEGNGGDERLNQIIDVSPEVQPLEVVRTFVESPNGNYYFVSLKPTIQNTKFDSYRLHYQQLFNNVGDPMFTADLYGRIKTANPAFAQVFGYDSVLPAGDNGTAEHADYEENLPNLQKMYVYKDELDDKIRQLVQDGRVFNMETHLYTQDHQIKRVLDTSWVIRNAHGTVKGYATQFKDVTYLRNIESRLKISERNFTILFDTIISSIIVLDENGRILNLNSAAEKVYRYKWENMVGEHYDSILRVSKESESFAKLKRLVSENEGKFIKSEVVRIRQDGEKIYTYAAFMEIRDSSGQVIAYSLTEKDLTERVHLENKLRDSFDQIKETQSAAIIGFAKLTEYRDKDTGRHLERIREFTRIMATTLRKNPEYTDYITDEYLEDLTLSSILHDVGKVGIEDQVLLKPGHLSEQEFDLIKRHVLLGGEALDVVDSKLDKKSFLTMGKEIARYHHERWDGKGYPEGLTAKEIPLSARIVAIADVYDALTSKRPYKEAYSHAKAVKIIAEERGMQFDPEIVDVFLENHEVFERVRKFIDFEENPETISELIDSIEE